MAALELSWCCWAVNFRFWPCNWSVGRRPPTADGVGRGCRRAGSRWPTPPRRTGRPGPPGPDAVGRGSCTRGYVLLARRSRRWTRLRSTAGRGRSAASRLRLPSTRLRPGLALARPAGSGPLWSAAGPTGAGRPGRMPDGRPRHPAPIAVGRVHDVPWAWPLGRAGLPVGLPLVTSVRPAGRAPPLPGDRLCRRPASGASASPGCRPPSGDGPPSGTGTSRAARPHRLTQLVPHPDRVQRDGSGGRGGAGSGAGRGGWAGPRPGNSSNRWAWRTSQQARPAAE